MLPFLTDWRLEPYRSTYTVVIKKADKAVHAMDVKDLINKAISLGYGVAETSKEQIEKLVDDLVKKGEISRAESTGFVNELVRKSEDAQIRMKSAIRDGVKSVIAELQLATKDDIERIERKLDALIAEKHDS
jgi:polyhydroxyalkanoate synthesis regulator phasin